MLNENNNQDLDKGGDEEEERHSSLKPTMSPVVAAFFGLGSVFILYQIVGSILTVAIFGFDLENADINALRLLTMGGQILLILFPALLFTKLIYEDVTTVIRFKLPNIKEIMLFVAGLIILTPLLQSYLYIQNYFIEQLADSYPIVDQLKIMLDKLDKLVEETYGSILEAHNIFEASFILFVVAVVPAICEETFFRGFVQKSFELKFKPFWAVLITGFFFSIYHFNPYGLFALIALGMYLGFAAYISNSIFIPMILHFLNNFFAVMVYFIFGTEDFIATDIVDTEGIGTSVASFILLLLIFLGFIYFAKNYHQKYLKH